jgi:hypothetical protein
MYKHVVDNFYLLESLYNCFTTLEDHVEEKETPKHIFKRTSANTDWESVYKILNIKNTQECLIIHPSHLFKLIYKCIKQIKILPHLFDKEEIMYIQNQLISIKLQTGGGARVFKIIFIYLG